MAKPILLATNPPPLPTMKIRHEGQEMLVTSHDLPKPGSFKWVNHKRKMFVMAVEHGLITEDDLRRLHGKTVELLKKEMLY